jgi:hypothetical protein
LLESFFVPFSTVSLQNQSGMFGGGQHHQLPTAVLIATSTSGPGQTYPALGSVAAEPRQQHLLLQQQQQQLPVQQLQLQQQQQQVYSASDQYSYMSEQPYNHEQPFLPESQYLPQPTVSQMPLQQVLLLFSKGPNYIHLILYQWQLERNGA